MEDASLAVLDCHEHRLVLARAALGLLGRGRGQHLQVLRRTAQLAVDFVAGMQPLGGEALHDGMIRRARHDQEVVLRRMHRVAGRRRVEDHRAVAPAHLRAPRLVASTPAADAGYLEKLRPPGERVVRGVRQHEAAPAADVLDEGAPGRLGPVVALVVHEDGAVTGEGRCECRHVLSLGGRRDDGDLEPAGVVQHASDGGAADGPVVVPVALAGEDHDLDPRLWDEWCSAGSQNHDRQEKDKTAEHRRMMAHGGGQYTADGRRPTSSCRERFRGLPTAVIM